MKQKELGRTGEFISQGSLGCMLMGTSIDTKESFRMLDYYKDMDGNFLDTANCYAWWIGKGENIGNESEKVIGQWMREKKNRDKIFLATKVGARLNNPEKIWDEKGVPKWHLRDKMFEYLSPNSIRKAVEGSLQRLQTDYIDLYYAHIDDRTTSLEETLETFNELVKEDKVKYIGCSNYKTWRLEKARNISIKNGWAPYVAIQQQYSYFRPKPGADFDIGENVNDELLDYLKVHDDITLVAYSPLLKGIYDAKQKREASYIWNSFNTDDSLSRLDILSKTAVELGVTNSQLVLAWLMHHQPTVIPIIGASSLLQLVGNMKSLDIQLTNEQISVLAATK